MNFQQLHYALTLAREGNFTKAAQKLYIAQPTLSIQIKELEKELNQTLFIRDRKSIKLTTEGEAFVAFAYETLNNYEKCKLEMDTDNKKGGSLKVGLYWVFGYTKYGKLLNKFLNEHPEIKCSIIVDGSIPLTEKIINNEIDVAIITGTYDISDHEYKSLSKDLNILLLNESPLVLLANKDSELALKKSITLDDLHTKNLFCVSKKSNMYHTVHECFEQNKIKPNIIGYSSQADICFQMAQLNLAYSFITLDTYNHFQDKADVLAIDIYPSITRKLYLIYSKDPKNKNIEIFKKYIFET